MSCSFSSINFNSLLASRTGLNIKICVNVRDVIMLLKPIIALFLADSTKDSWSESISLYLVTFSILFAMVVRLTISLALLC